MGGAIRRLLYNLFWVHCSARQSINCRLELRGWRRSSKDRPPPPPALSFPHIRNLHTRIGRRAYSESQTRTDVPRSEQKPRKWFMMLLTVHGWTVGLSSVAEASFWNRIKQNDSWYSLALLKGWYKSHSGGCAATNLLKCSLTRKQNSFHRSIWKDPDTPPPPSTHKKHLFPPYGSICEVGSCLSTRSLAYFRYAMNFPLISPRCPATALSEKVQAAFITEVVGQSSASAAHVQKSAKGLFTDDMVRN